jgi:ferritin-like protein
MAGNSASFHESLDKLSTTTQDTHRALVSLQEELEAVDWYQQRADACADDALRAILLHNMHEEIEHASMILEWLRRHHPGFDQHLRTYLFTSQTIVDIEEKETGDQGQTETGLEKGKPHDLGLTVGPMKGD